MDDECVILSSEVVICAVIISFFPACKAGVSSPSSGFRAGHPKRVSKPVFLVSREKKRGTFCLPGNKSLGKRLDRRRITRSFWGESVQFVF